MVMFIYRDEVYNPETDRKNIADIIVAKHRNGPVGQVSLYFQAAQTLLSRPRSPHGGRLQPGGAYHMPAFTGFPPGKNPYVPLPEQFFTTLAAGDRGSSAS